MTDPATSTETQPNKLPVVVGRPLDGLDEAFRLSKALALASLLPADLRGKPNDVLALMLYGQDLGLTPMQSIQGIYVVKGKPQLASQTWTGLARRAGHKVRIIESTDKQCTVEIVRCDDADYPHMETFTIDDAIRAGLCRRDDKGQIVAKSAKGDPLPWQAYTKTMLRNRALSNAGKVACPEVAMGFAIEGDLDYVPDDDPIEVTQPEHHGEPRPQADVAADLAQAVAQFNETDIEDAVIVPDPPAADPTATDPESTLFAEADEQAAQEMGNNGATS
jgi:hypothetical protein